MSFILQTDGFVETGECDGPRNIRNAPNREQTGVTMTEIQDKYIAEFELPYRNVDRYIKEVKNNWNRLNDKQRESIKKSFEDMGLIGQIEEFANEEYIGNCNTLDSSIRYVLEEPQNIRNVLNSVWRPANNQIEEYKMDEDNLKQIRENIYNWSVDNAFTLHTNWKSGCALGFIIIFFLLIGVLIGSAAKN